MLATALASGLLLWLASPSVGLGPFAWVALVPAAVLHLRRPTTRAGRAVVPLTYVVFLELQLVPALPFGIAKDQWGHPVLPVLVGDSPVLAAALIGVPLLGSFLYAIRFPQPWGEAALRSGLVAVLVPAVSWTALDLVRVRYDPSGLWGALHLTQHESGTRSAAALAGPLLLTWMVVAVNFALALLVVRGRRALPALALVGGAALAAALATLSLGPVEGERVTVAVVQPGYDTSEWDHPAARYFDPARRDVVRASLDVVEDLGRLTRTAAERGVRIVAWPEAVVWIDPIGTRPVRRELVALAAEMETTVLVPHFRPALRKNAAIGVHANGSLGLPQPKQRPMWFLGERPRDRPTEPIPAPAADVGVLLGVDNQEARSARTLARRGATVLVSSTHDWRELAEQQRALSRLNAAAVRLPLARADWRYGSLIVDARGRTLADAGHGRSRAVLVAEVDARPSDAPYTRIGDILGWIALAVALGVSLAAMAARRRGGA